MKSKQMKFAKPGKKLWSDTNNIMKQMFLRGFALRNPLVGPVDCLPAWRSRSKQPTGTTATSRPKEQQQ